METSQLLRYVSGMHGLHVLNAGLGFRVWDLDLIFGQQTPKKG